MNAMPVHTEQTYLKLSENKENQNMTDTTSGGEFNAETQLVIEKVNSARTHAIICYALMLLACLTGFTSLIALIWAYVKRGDAVDTPLQDHFSNIISTFWISLVLGIVGVFTTIFVVGYFILIGTGIWVLYRMIKGLIRAMDRKPFNA